MLRKNFFKSICVCALLLPSLNPESPAKSERNNGYSEKQKFLDDLLIKENMQHCSGLVYDSKGEKAEKYFNEIRNPYKYDVLDPKFMDKFRDNLKRSYAFSYTSLNFMADGKKHPVFVLDTLFNEPSFSKKEIEHIIRYHEGRHAEQHNKGFKALGYYDEKLILAGILKKEIESEVVSELLELDATQNEIDAIHAKKSEVSKEFYHKTISKYIECYSGLYSKSKEGSKLQKEVIDSFLDNQKIILKDKNGLTLKERLEKIEK